MQYHHTKAGYSLIEVLVAITILLLAIVGPLSIASAGLQAAGFARQQTTAIFLAQEGIEGIHYLRERGGLVGYERSTDPWNWFLSAIPNACRTNTNVPCRININNSTTAFSVERCNATEDCDIYRHDSGGVRYMHESSGGEPTGFNRSIYMRRESTNVLHVRSVVTWDANQSGQTETVELETYIYNIYADL